MMKTFLFYFRFLTFCFFKTTMFAIIDVSGSAGPDRLKKIDNLLRLVNNFTCLFVITFDHRMLSVRPYSPLVGLNLYGPGAGGTDVNEAVNYVNNSGAEGLMIFTDGYLPPPATTPKMSTLWVIAPDIGAKLDESYPGKKITCCS